MKKRGTVCHTVDEGRRKTRKHRYEITAHAKVNAWSHYAVLVFSNENFLRFHLQDKHNASIINFDWRANQVQR